MTSSATSEYVPVIERIGQNEEPANKNIKRARNKHSSAPKMYLNETQYDLMYCEHVNKNYLSNFIYVDAFLLIFYLLWKSFDLLCLLVFIVSLRE